MELRPRPLSRGPLVLALVAAALAALALAAPSRAHAAVVLPDTQTQVPKGYRMNAEQAIAAAERVVKVQKELKRHPGQWRAYGYVSRPRNWQVSWFDKNDKERMQVLVDDPTGTPLEAWTGYQVAWRMARGYPGAFGKSFNAIWLWLPLGLVFLLPFVDFRNPFRLLHLDMLMLVAFVVSHVFFEKGNIGVSVPLAYPVLAYLLIRMLIAGFRPRRPRGRLVPYVPTWVLALGILFLVGFRVGLNMVDSNVIDVGYSGVIGANHIVHGKELYNGSFPVDNEHGDTYGPVDYLAYVPFERIWPWSGKWDDLPAAHAAAVAFDLLTLLGLFLLGRRLRAGPAGTNLGTALAFAWAAYPYSLFVLSTNSNDSLVAALVVFAMLALSSAPGRGLMLGLAGAAKFAPLALAPLFARGRDALWSRRTLIAGAVMAATVVVAFAPFIPPGGLHQLYDRSIGSQINRSSPFSIWGQTSLDWLQVIWQAGCVALALVVAVVPKRRSDAQIAALAAAVLIAFQMAADHWFYLYVVWFAPLIFVALFSAYEKSTKDDDAEDWDLRPVTRDLRPSRQAPAAAR